MNFRQDDEKVRCPFHFCHFEKNIVTISLLGHFINNGILQKRYAQKVSIIKSDVSSCFEM